MNPRIVKETNGAGRSVYYIEDWDGIVADWVPLTDPYCGRWETRSERKAKRELRKYLSERNVTRRVVWP